MRQVSFKIVLSTVDTLFRVFWGVSRDTVCRSDGAFSIINKWTFQGEFILRKKNIPKDQIRRVSAID